MGGPFSLGPGCVSDKPGLKPEIVWDDRGPRSVHYDDVYFSREDGLGESQTVYLQGCGLPDAWAGRDRFTVAELGFGTGLNIAALLDLWRRTSPPDARLSVFSVEAHLMFRQEALRALERWGDALGEPIQALLAAWPSPRQGFHRIDLPDFRTTLDLYVGEVGEALQRWSGPADAWFLDGFAPARNPQMWRDEVLAAVAELSAPGASILQFQRKERSPLRAIRRLWSRLASTPASVRRRNSMPRPSRAPPSCIDVIRPQR